MIQIVLSALGAVLLASAVFIVGLALVTEYIIDSNEQEYESYD